MITIRHCFYLIVLVWGSVAYADKTTSPTVEAATKALADTPVYTVPESDSFRQQISIFEEPELIKVTDKVYLAYAFDMVNCIFVIGDSGVVVIDTLSRVETASRALKQLRRLTSKPIAAIIYSHGHFDHTGGSAAFAAENSENEIPVYASAVWPRYRQELASPLYPMINRRMIEQFGFAVATPGATRYEHILGPIDPSANTQSYVQPTHTVSEATTLTLAGVDIELVPIPSEMDDELVIRIPSEGVAYAADTMSHTYPFLATPRSEPSRSPKGIIKAKDIMLDWQADHLVLGHGPISSGKDKVKEQLQAHRDAEQIIWDQTIAAINAGKTRNEAAEAVRLPAHLKNDPTMVDSYHRASWVVKGLYTDLSGWYGNDALEFIQHPPREEAIRMVQLAGGAPTLLKQAEHALKAKDNSWAAQLATYLLLSEQNVAAAKQIKIAALKAEAAATHSSNERYYLLSGALWLEQGASVSPAFSLAEQVEMVPTAAFLEFLGPRLNIARSVNTMLKVNLDVQDTQEHFRLSVRRGALERRVGSHKKPDLTLRINRQSLLEFATSLASATDLLNEGKIQASGEARAFLELFD